MTTGKVKNNYLTELIYKLTSIGLMILCFFSLNIFFASGFAYAGGTTIITHGWGSGTEGWIDYMDSAIFWRLRDVMEAKEVRDISGTELAGLGATYKIKITNELSNLANSDYKKEYQIGFCWGIEQVTTNVSMAESGSGEVFILIDWSDFDTLGEEALSTKDVAFLVRDALYSQEANSAFGGSPLSTPIHLIGHSRGGSLMGAIAEDFGEANIWVDHVTFLDPHPILIPGMDNDWGYDSGMIVSDNVRFADNYYRQGGGGVPEGYSVAGAANIELNNDFLDEDDWGGYTISGFDEHTDVHLWYHGTIDITAGITDGTESLNSSQVSEWYSASNGMPGPRYETGYNYSRIVGRDRFPLNIGLARESSRPFITEKTLTPWANLDAPLIVNTSSPVTIGNNISVGYRYQALDDCSISFGFDEDSNPFNNNETYLHTILSLPATSNGTIFDNGVSSNIPIETSGMSKGKYYIVAKITGSSGYTRYVHSSNVIELVEGDPPPGPDPDFREPNNSPAQATDLGIVSGAEAWESGVRITSGDVDYYKFEIIATGTYKDSVAIYLTEGSGIDTYDLDVAIGELNRDNELVPANGEKYWVKSMSQSEHRLNEISIEGYDPGIYYAIVYGGSAFTDSSETTPDYDFSKGTEVSDYNLSIEGPLPKVNTPVILPDGGEFTGPKQVILTCPDHRDAEIHYTTDGTNPTASSTLYEGPFTVSSAVTVKAIAIKSNYADSDVMLPASFAFVPELSVTPITLNVGADSGAASFNVDNTGSDTMSWSASVISGESWLSITSEPSGTNSGLITVSFSANTLASTQKGTIRITASGATAGSPTDVTVLQSGLVTPASLIAWGNSDRVSDTPTGNDFIAISAGTFHSLALKSDGSLVSWGNDFAGSISNKPAGNDFIAIAVNDHSLALKSDGSIVSWGWDFNRQVSNTPSGNDFIDISAGEGHSLALKSDGSLAEWGDAYNLLLRVNLDTPLGNDFIAISAGNGHSLALKSDGSIVSWGNNKYEQVSSAPLGNDFIAISDGGDHCLALKSDGSIVSWGRDNYGQVRSAPSGNDFIAISAGSLHSLALKSDGLIVSWGRDNYGQVSSAPSGNGFIAISDGSFHSLALKKAFTSVPDVFGLSETNAESAILSASLTVGIITNGYSDIIPAGYIISQNPVGGSTTITGSAVNIVISLGAIDSDDDGVADNKDVCPDTPTNSVVNTKGCIIGDVNTDGSINLTDSQLGLKAITLQKSSVDFSAEIDGDDTIGLKDVIYIIQQTEKNRE
jgi:hypothetical protein